VEALPPICTSNSGSFSSTTSSGSLSARMRGAGSYSAGISSGKPPLQRREGAAAAAAAAQHKFSKATLTSSCEMKTLVHNTLRKRHTVRGAPGALPWPASHSSKTLSHATVSATSPSLTPANRPAPA
jgi:hypothetical protein